MPKTFVHHGLYLCPDVLGNAFTAHAEFVAMLNELAQFSRKILRMFWGRFHMMRRQVLEAPEALKPVTSSVEPQPLDSKA